MLVAACCNAILRVAHHGTGVPRHDAVNDLVSLVPSPFGLRHAFIDQDSLAIRNPKGLDVELLDYVKNERRSMENLLAGNDGLADHFSEHTIVLRRKILTVEFQEGPNIGQINWAIWVAQAAKNLCNLSINVLNCFCFEKAVLYCLHRYVTYSS